MDLNGEKPAVIGIQINKNFETQAVTINFDNTVFRTWDEVLGAIEAAKREAEFQLNMGRALQMQKAQHEAAQALQIKNRLRI